MTRVEEALWLARKFLFVREVDGPVLNTGPWVEAIQTAFHGIRGEAWCAYFVSFVLSLVYGGPDKVPIGVSGSTFTLLTKGQMLGWEVQEPAVGDLFFRLKPPDKTDSHIPHHVGFVTDTHHRLNAINGVGEITSIGTISGNTSEDGASSNGIGVFEHDIAVVPGRLAFVRWSR